MTVFNFPFTSTSPGNAGPYSAELFRSWVETLFTGKNRADAGVLLLSGDGVDDPLEVQQTSPASAQVLVKPGAALVDGCWYYHDADETVAIAANTSGNPRIDYIVLRLNATAQTVTLVDLQGTPAGSPVPPTLTQTDAQYEIPIAEIEVDNLFTTIVTADIDNTVRSFARLAQWEEGGTSRSSYSAREHLIGKADGSLGIEYLSAFNVAHLSTTGTITGGSWQTLALVEQYDPDGLITVASNQITFAKAGGYLALPLAYFLSTATALAFRLRDITNGVTLTHTNSPTSAGSRFQATFKKPFLIPANNTVTELQVWLNVNGSFTLESQPGAIGETFDAYNMAFLRWG